jgi:hypothetical protein
MVKWERHLRIAPVLAMHDTPEARAVDRDR